MKIISAKMQQSVSCVGQVLSPYSITIISHMLLLKGKLKAKLVFSVFYVCWNFRLPVVS